jgi:hypothetical protein
MVVVWGTYYAFGVFFKPVLIEFGWTRAITSGAFSLALVIHGLLGIAMGWLTTTGYKVWISKAEFPLQTSSMILG